MRLEDFPRPPNDNGVGIHFDEPTAASIKKYLPLMKELHMTWVVLADQSDPLLANAVPKFLDAGIMPIVRVDRKINASQNWYVLTKKCGSGLMQIYNEEGDPREYKSDKRPDNFWELFRGKWIGAAHEVVRAGGYPGLQTGDPERLRDMLIYMAETGEQELWDSMWLSLHLYPPLTKPPLHPEPPYVCQPDCTEHHYAPQGFRHYAAVCEEIIGHPLPVIVTEAAYTPSMGTPEQRAKWMVEIYRWFEPQIVSTVEDATVFPWKVRHELIASAPDYLLAYCDFILFGPKWYGFSWAKNPAHWPKMEAVKAMGEWVRGKPEEPPTPPEPEPEEPKNWRVVSPWVDYYSAHGIHADLGHEYPEYDWQMEERE